MTADDKGSRQRASPSLSDVGFNVFERFEQYQSSLAERLTRACRALEESSIPYAVVGGQAVIAWVASVDESAIRSTQDADILVDRQQLPAVISALSRHGFTYRHAAGLDFFTEGPGGKVREGVRLLFADEKVRPEYPVAAPSTSEAEHHLRSYRVISLARLVEMKLASHRLKDRVHLQDMAGVGLLQGMDPDEFHPVLSARLRHLLANPEE